MEEYQRELEAKRTKLASHRKFAGVFSDGLIKGVPYFGGKEPYDVTTNPEKYFDGYHVSMATVLSAHELVITRLVREIAELEAFITANQ